MRASTTSAKCKKSQSLCLKKCIIFIRITSKAAIAAYKYIGKENKILADKAAVDVMRSEINKLDIDGKIVIGEG